MAGPEDGPHPGAGLAGHRTGRPAREGLSAPVLPWRLGSRLGPASPWRRLGAALWLAGLLFVLVATLTPTRDVLGLAALTPLLCLVCGDHGGADVAANLLLFLPFAIGVRLSGASWRRTVVLSALLSFTVELLQYLWVPGRDASLSDLLTNTTGGAIGAMIGTGLPTAVVPGPSRAMDLLRAGAAAVGLLLGLSAWLLMPWTPEGPLLSRWAHQAPGKDVFGGRVRSVVLDGQPMPRNGTPPDSAGFRRRLDGGAFALDADLISGAPVEDRAWIYMFRVRAGGALTVSQLGRDAGVAVPARALRFLLWPPILTLPDGLPGTAGSPVHLTATETGRRLRLRTSYGGTERSVELGLSPAYGWVLVMPFELARGTRVRWITGLCLALALLPLGYWASRTGRPGAAGAILAAVLAAGLGAVPAVAGLPPVHWSEWLAGALGAAAGWALHRPAAYLERQCVSPSGSESSSS